MAFQLLMAIDAEPVVTITSLSLPSGVGIGFVLVMWRLQFCIVSEFLSLWGESRIALLSSFGERSTVRSMDLSSACLTKTLSIVIVFSLLMASVAGPIWQIASLSLPSSSSWECTFSPVLAGASVLTGKIKNKKVGEVSEGS